MSLILKVDHLRKVYGQTSVLSDVSLGVRSGEFTVLLGPSGSGKSTLFKSVMGLVKPDHGTIEFAGTELGTLRSPARRLVTREIGLIFQAYNLVTRLSAIDNVLGGRLANIRTWRVIARLFPDHDRQIALGALDTVGLLEKAYHRADRLSGGQQQRVAIARVMAQECRLILADEPVASLDPESAKTVLETLRGATRRRGIAVLCSLHQLNYATEFADRILVLRNGRIVLDAERCSFDRQDFGSVYRQAA